MQKYKVSVTTTAHNDIMSIYNYVAINDSFENADEIIENINKSMYSLESMAKRGHKPPEFDQLQMWGFYEIRYSVYRIIYQIIDDHVYVISVLDSRRNLKELLSKRFYY